MGRDTKEKASENAKIPWNKIKHEYVTGNVTYKELSEKYNVSIETIKKKARKTAKRKGWVLLKQEHRNKVYTKAEQKSADKSVKEILSNKQRIQNAAEDLLSEAEKAVKQLSSLIVEHEVVEKETEFDYTVKKPKKEKTTTIKDIEVVEGLVDTKALKNLSDAFLKISTLLAGTDPEDKGQYGIIELPAIEEPVPPEEETSENLPREEETDD